MISVEQNTYSKQQIQTEITTRPPITIIWNQAGKLESSELELKQNLKPKTQY